ncbi:uncharacterized protein LOC132799988 [Ziziphus jujuba]|uniref:Uncharacterized protein LOC132799988 n=1 Tax=Ziziphus jujuba TaxID=326968 RepID=A0ABM3ZWF8_ZIZJJ|nr:uncharacterized protein LOC132799988 [Ziziphus jujuba]
MVIMGAALSSTTEKSFRCIYLVASSNIWARQHIAWKIKPLATMSTKFSASSLILNQSFPNPYNTGLLRAAFIRQGTSNWQLKHKSLNGSQIRSINIGDRSNDYGMGTTADRYFPKFSGQGNPHEITNRGDYESTENGILYKDIVHGENGKCIQKGGKIVIRYKIYDERKNRASPDTPEQTIRFDKIPTGVREGIATMKLKGRRLIIIPRNLAGYHQDVKHGEHAIYDVTLLKIY